MCIFICNKADSLHLSLHILTGWDNEIDIQKTIQLMRAQRPGMVQTEVKVIRNFCATFSRKVTCIQAKDSIACH